MNVIATFADFEIYPLTKELAEKYAQDIIETLDLIPEVANHTKEGLLSEKKGDRILHAKWEHSIIALTKEKQFAGVIIGYEREKEGNEQYPENCIYLNSIAVSSNYQKHGLGKELTKTWIRWNSTQGFLELTGPTRFAVQTNSADWNTHVQRLYESCDFVKTAEKQYDNRTDTVYTLVVKN